MKVVNITEAVEKQDMVIRLQTEVIDELFELLSQHLCTEDICSIPCLDTMRKISDMVDYIPGKDRTGA